MRGLLVAERGGEGGQDSHKLLGRVLSHCTKAFLISLFLLGMLEHVISLSMDRAWVILVILNLVNNSTNTLNLFVGNITTKSMLVREFRNSRHLCRCC